MQTVGSWYIYTSMRLLSLLVIDLRGSVLYSRLVRRRKVGGELFYICLMVEAARYSDLFIVKVVGKTQFSENTVYCTIILTSPKRVLMTQVQGLLSPLCDGLKGNCSRSIDPLFRTAIRK